MAKIRQKVKVYPIIFLPFFATFLIFQKVTKNGEQVILKALNLLINLSSFIHYFNLLWMDYFTEVFE